MISEALRIIELGREYPRFYGVVFFNIKGEDNHQLETLKQEAVHSQVFIKVNFHIKKCIINQIG